MIARAFFSRDIHASSSLLFSSSCYWLFPVHSLTNHTHEANMIRWTTPEYTKILTASLIDYTQANLKERADIVKEIKAKIRESAEHTQKPLPDDLNSVNELFYVHFLLI
jgi:hypothetical protein